MSPKNQSRRLEAGFSLTELLIVVAIIGILAAVATNQLIANLRLGRQTAAVESLRTIHHNQAQFNAMKGKFGTLKELAEAGLLEATYASGNPVSQYVYKDSDVSADQYCVHADRQSDTAAYRDFNVIEDGIIRYVESKSKGTVPRGEGLPLSNVSGESGNKGAGAEPQDKQAP